MEKGDRGGMCLSRPRSSDSGLFLEPHTRDRVSIHGSRRSTGGDAKCDPLPGGDEQRGCDPVRFFTCPFRVGAVHLFRRPHRVSPPSPGGHSLVDNGRRLGDDVRAVHCFDPGRGRREGGDERASATDYWGEGDRLTLVERFSRRHDGGHGWGEWVRRSPLHTHKHTAKRQKRGRRPNTICVQISARR